MNRRFPAAGSMEDVPVTLPWSALCLDLRGPHAAKFLHLRHGAELWEAGDQAASNDGRNRGSIWRNHAVRDDAALLGLNFAQLLVVNLANVEIAAEEAKLVHSLLQTAIEVNAGDSGLLHDGKLR
mmetsp:Transcript_95272/g.116638  ORF Transcript_95272/g.116638 Transcript_95272/m.116638 type:complete len:125 (+) Transcript_95272:74-448(+)|eukprot:CAMPEP_0114669194 /NCGR_PEP_ID=MMETSP0191-20121206/37712_1 /TAXON_ID=126664 /ORGANISM="Sorites sp." /LENGTH=124 /DNA_ID=CAMNT_0001924389 /DNA_START=74 /DNA_END=448 /DNA_ORIENTATION=+